MQKPFLLLAGFIYYPSLGVGDWKGCFATLQEARSKIKVIQNKTDKRTRDKRTRDKKTRESYEINGELYDWYEIVNLKKWTE